MEKVTIHRALTELKTIANRIEKAINDFVPSGMQQKDKLVSYKTREVFEKDVKGSYQSVIDLIQRRDNIKSAIVKANSETKLTIAGKELTIADAIDLKNTIGYKKRFIETARQRNNAIKAQIEKNNAIVDQNALNLASSALSKANVKLGDDDVMKVVAPYIEANRFTYIDPLTIEKKIEEMENEINDFESEVDAALSEINAVTFITF